MSRSPTTRRIIFLVLGLIVSLGLLLLPVSGYTRLTVADADSGRRIFTTILRDGAPVVLRWTNSLYRLPVTESYFAHAGVLIQDQVIFGAGAAPTVTPADVEDLYHTGGAFAARGLNRPLQQVIFRIGEIGRPQFKIGERIVNCAEEVGFGGRIALTTRRARLSELVGHWVCSLPFRRPRVKPGSSGVVC